MTEKGTYFTNPVCTLNFGYYQFWSETIKNISSKICKTLHFKISFKNALFFIKNSKCTFFESKPNTAVKIRKFHYRTIRSKWFCRFLNCWIDNSGVLKVIKLYLFIVTYKYSFIWHLKVNDSFTWLLSYCYWSVKFKILWIT